MKNLKARRWFFRVVLLAWSRVDWPAVIAYFDMYAWQIDEKLLLLEWLDESFRPEAHVHVLDLKNVPSQYNLTSDISQLSSANIRSNHLRQSIRHVTYNEVKQKLLENSITKFKETNELQWN